MQLIPGLRAQGAQIIIALTHMREPNDLKLAENVPPGFIDLIIGGHDHFYAHHYVNGVHVLRSGTDFKQLSYIEARRKEKSQPGWDFDIVRRDITRDILEDEATVKLVESLTSSLKQKLEKPIGYTAVPLDGRFTTVRTKESNLGNFVCDLMRYHYNTDCTIMAAGTIRGDQIYPPGVLLLKDIMNCFPFEDPVIVISVTGSAILSALESSVSLVPALEGRYPQVSNIRFAYNPRFPSGSRVLWAHINNHPLDHEKEYTMATRGYMGRGKDGYDSLLVESEGGSAKEIIAEENGILISMVLRQYFMSLKVLGKWRRWGPSLGRHWGSVHERLHAGGKVREPGNETFETPEQTRRTQIGSPNTNARTRVDGHLVDSDTNDEQDISSGPANQQVSEKDNNQKQRESHVARTAMKKWMRIAGVRRESVGMVMEEEQPSGFLPHWTRAIAPR